MDAVKIIRDANWRLDVGDITIGQYEKLIAPLRDVEAVVRCKDCRHIEHCTRLYTKDGFCSDGERKDGDHHEG